MPATIYLYRYMQTAWHDVVAPWLDAGTATGTRKLERSYVVVPTRGQAHAFKQQCLAQNISLLGVELLTPGLARRKWAERISGTQLAQPLGREFLLLGLRTIIERKLAPLTEDTRERGLLISLQSDCERALGDFDDLLRSGFSANDFPEPIVQEVFNELAQWVEKLGYGFVAQQTLRFVREGNLQKIPGRLLIHGFSAEQRNEFYNIAAFACCFQDVTATLPAEKILESSEQVEEKWIELWEKLLGTASAPLDDTEPPTSCESIAELWMPSKNFTGTPITPSTHTPVQFVIGATRTAETNLVIEKIETLLSRGAENIGVIFPAGDIAHQQIATTLARKKTPFADQIGTTGTPPVEIIAQRSLISFYQNDCTLEGLLELWPLLRGEHAPKLPLGGLREICERAFDECQSNRLSFAKHAIEKERKNAKPQAIEAQQDVVRIVNTLLAPENPLASDNDCPIDETLKAFSKLCEIFSLGEIPGHAALDEFSRREKNPLPKAVVLSMLDSFLPSKSQSRKPEGRGSFARVTLTTRNRAEGALWSHLIFVESNAGIWPRHQESSCWLDDEARAALNESGRTEIELLKSTERASLEKYSYAALARDTSTGIIFSASLCDEQNTELKLAPNTWAERIGWHIFAQHGGKANELDEAFKNHAQETPRPQTDENISADTNTQPSLERWHAIWKTRRDPEKKFDEYFLCTTPEHPRIESLAAREIEAGVQDPASLWFKEVLGAERVDWTPFERSRRKNLGTLAHRVMAEALKGDEASHNIQQLPAEGEARSQMAKALTALRSEWPNDRYWDSFHAELSNICDVLLTKVYHKLFDDTHAPGPYVATELYLSDETAKIPLDEKGEHMLPITGFIDLLRLDRTTLAGADVDIVDFKTGEKDPALTAKGMGEKGTLLQLGIYLAAAKSLGAADGRVWVVRPSNKVPQCIHMADATVQEGKALACLKKIRTHITTGMFGALTKAPSEYSQSTVEWPIACVPIQEKILKKKYDATFAFDSAADEESEAADV